MRRRRVNKKEAANFSGLLQSFRCNRKCRCGYRVEFSVALTVIAAPVGCHRAGTVIISGTAAVIIGAVDRGRAEDDTGCSCCAVTVIAVTAIITAAVVSSVIAPAVMSSAIAVSVVSSAIGCTAVRSPAAAIGCMAERSPAAANSVTYVDNRV